jgi:hypothetical protein
MPRWKDISLIWSGEFAFMSKKPVFVWLFTTDWARRFFFDIFSARKKEDTPPFYPGVGIFAPEMKTIRRLWCLAYLVFLLLMEIRLNPPPECFHPYSKSITFPIH